MFGHVETMIEIPKQMNKRQRTGSYYSVRSTTL